LIVESTNRLQSWELETSAGMMMTSGDPNNLAMLATSLSLFSLLATSARRAPLLPYSYARCFEKQIKKEYKEKKSIALS